MMQSSLLVVMVMMIVQTAVSVQRVHSWRYVIIRYNVKLLSVVFVHGT